MEKREFREFWCRKGGQVAVIMALMMLPIAAVVGFAIDSSRQVTAKQTLQDATDIATLAGAKNLAETRNILTARRVAASSFKPNKENKHSDVTCTIDSYSTDLANLELGLETSCEIPTIFGTSISGKAKTNVKSVSIAKASVSKLDLVLALDNSNSMTGQKIRALKNGATALIEDLATADGRVRFALVPYNSSVNAGVYGNRAAGLDDDDDSAGDGADKVCVTERGEGEAFTDAKPQANAWVNTSSVRKCPNQTIVPLSNDVDALKTVISGLSANKSTGGHIAVAWAWYLISPNWADMWPVDSQPLPYGNPREIKAMVLMTDGAFNKVNISSQGSASTQAEALCSGARGSGIIIFSIAYRTGTSAKRMMRRCATSPDHYFNATNEVELKAAFKTIGRQFYGVSIVD